MNQTKQPEISAGMNNLMAQQLLGILKVYTGDDIEARKWCTEMYNQMWHDGLTGKEIAGRLAGALHDGLVRGNWPWLYGIGDASGPSSSPSK